VASDDPAESSAGGEPDRPRRHLHLHHVTLFVRDQDRSRSFFVDQLGFRLVADAVLEGLDRWVAVAPPNGTALIALLAPKPGTPEHELIGRSSRIVLLTEDIAATVEEWSARGVAFRHPPRVPPWGGTFTTFEDVDGNPLTLVGFDDVSRRLEAERQAVASRAEAERHAAQELEIARQVQARLFPQVLPPLRTLDYAGVCIQAHQVGGDYYDFLELGGKRLGLVVGDISGKGIGAALLMAHLQANLRGQCAVASDEPQRFLRSVNQLFRENTPDSAYATLAFAEYDDTTRRLRYASCGHPSALLLRAEGRLERLESTGTALGLFKEWDCEITQRQLSPGDTLVLHSDGVAESFNEAGEEFGEERLVQALRGTHGRSAQEVLASVVDEVRRFSPHEQHDDITLIVARCREG
jgi:serine phosphatase RsbU (regulator of sigma subunit)